MDGGSREVTLGEEVLSLTPLEYGYSRCSCAIPARPCPANTLSPRCGAVTFYGPTKTLDVHIRHLREKIEDDPSRPRYIVTVRGIGYRLEKTGGGAKPCRA